MKYILKLMLVIIMTSFLQSYAQKTTVDIIVHNGNIYTIDNEFSVKQSFAVLNGNIIETGTNEIILGKYSAQHTIDLKGKFVYPGLIDAHCHFYGYAKNLQWLDLTGTNSFEEIVELLKTYHKQNPNQWILGRGWDQNDWEKKQYPTNKLLNELFPNAPVILTRIDGHAVIANQHALGLANITNTTKIEGGEVILDKGKLTGLLIDNAAYNIKSIIPLPSNLEMDNLLIRAQKNCFEVGLTTVSDAGLDKYQIEQIDNLQSLKKIKMRIYAMLSPSKNNFDTYVINGPLKNDLLNVRSIKLYIDGALGSRGARLIKPYTDDPNNSGLIVTLEETIDSICNFAYLNGYQVNTHAIGDDGVRTVLDIYAKYLKGKNDLRWRIEHSQIVHPDDIEKYGKYSIIPSIQTTHATSDMYWADERLGPERVKTAYAYKQLLDQNGWIPNGSDFPVESINPLYGFYAAISRKDKEGFPENGFQMKNALSRQEALKAMTIWAAKSNFEENEKGSIETGKFADFVILEEDLMTIDESQIPRIQILATYIGGEKVFEKDF